MSAWDYWDTDLIARMNAVRAGLKVHQGAIRTTESTQDIPGPVLNRLVDALTARLAEEDLPHDISVRDVQAATEVLPETGQVEVTIAWNPHSDTAILLTGPADGMVLARVNHPERGIDYAAESSSTDFSPAMEALRPSAQTPVIPKTHYEMVGWLQERRAWVMKPV